MSSSSYLPNCLWTIIIYNTQHQDIKFIGLLKQKNGPTTSGYNQMENLKIFAKTSLPNCSYIFMYTKAK